MHLIPTIPGGWNPNGEGVFHIQQQPGDIVFLSAADTEIHSLNNAYRELYQQAAGERSLSRSIPGNSPLPSLRIANLVYLKQELTIDKYVEEVIGEAKLVICRLLGGKNYYPYLFEAVSITCELKKIPVLFLPGYDVPDIELLNSSTVDIHIADTVWKYLCAGGRRNHLQCLQYVFHTFFQLPYEFEAPQRLPDLFLFHPERGIILSGEEHTIAPQHASGNAVILVYQTHYLADNLEPVYYLATALEQQGINPVIAFASNLRDQATCDELFNLLQRIGTSIDVILNTTSFSIKSLLDTTDDQFIFRKMNVPVIQAIFASCTKEIWQENLFGLTPTDVAMNIALPEIDGRIITTAVSFKSSLGRDALTDSDILKYTTHEEGCDFVVAFARHWIAIRNKENKDKRIALIMPNYPNKDSRLANGVGLDTPASMIEILHALKTYDYHVGEFVPADSAELIELITHYITNDTDTALYRPYQVSLKLPQFYQYYNALSSVLREKIEQQWGQPEDSPNYHADEFIIPGFLLGNIFVSIQPARGYNQDIKAIYHSPDLPPTYAYLAYYCWVNNVFNADAVVHVGKHGNLEWLPGKSVALSKETCFPAVLLNPIPHFYPFIINDPGEGTQAKRRNHAIIIDHLIPPMTRAESYGILTKLEHLIDEYYDAYSIDPKRTAVIKTQITQLVAEANLEADLQSSVKDIDELLLKLDGYLCELKEAQIRDGLHILGKVPEGEQLTDLLVALHRVPVAGKMGITQVLAQDLGLALDPLNCDYQAAFIANNPHTAFSSCRINGDVIAVLEGLAKTLISEALTGTHSPIAALYPLTRKYCQFIIDNTLPKIQATNEEITNLLQGLNGHYVPSGSSGAPTRGRLDVLPTGRNFYSVDVRAIPTQTAYNLGVKSANLIIDRYLQEHGDYPESIGLSVWGTSTMRTGGDDIAQALALMGVKPVWQTANRRVSDFEIIPLITLRRPRVDVMLRISGFFRDAFPDVISLFNAAVEKVAQLDEPFEQNPVRKRFLKEKEEWQSKGLNEEKAHKRALFRVFGSKPGAYGAGLQAVIDEKNWQSREDLAKVYINWSGYAYGADRIGESAHEVFEKRLSDIQIVMHNQDNREHDILDSDDYYQFQGGLANAVQTITGTQPSIYFGDHARPEHPQVKTLKQELLKVYRSRVINPKWIAGVKRHGYKGAFEMAATMDYLFAYDATTDLIDDFMYEGITRAYLFDEENRQFIEQVNPWALKDMTERMLEAIQRGMWKHPEKETLERLQQLFVDQE
ncbi:cobaltochelatase subunit CobN [Chitinophaga ginsengisoli]|uniref:Cobaltochelatase CobN subunit n=1 Tax=Chitinophaga ginsengisoli TaxID=363837 RepID=A0A2P8FXE6_9BACT|nr:cobaltochelatase subunit CobN [Chitinophaga ginsengisoli]PSL26396.1 cobaltochelatase CobN subunit [Chitinophaga ginsengisoli]